MESHFLFPVELLQAVTRENRESVDTGPDASAG